MSDFSELCPIFNSGVYNEITFPNIDMRDITASGNALYGSLFPSITMAGYFTFGRTVVITGAFARMRDVASLTLSVNLRLKHYTSVAAAGTVFASASFGSLASLCDAYAYYPFTFSVSQTFTSTDILGLSPSLGAVSGVGSYDLIVRYRDK